MRWTRSGAPWRTSPSPSRHLGTSQGRASQVPRGARREPPAPRPGGARADSGFPNWSCGLGHRPVGEGDGGGGQPFLRLTLGAQVGLRRAKLVAVSAWTPRQLSKAGPARPPAVVPLASREIERRALEDLRAAVEAVLGEQPPVECEVAPERMSRVLLEPSSGAQLLVLGPPHRSDGTVLTARPRISQVVRPAHCPVGSSPAASGYPGRTPTLFSPPRQRSAPAVVSDRTRELPDELAGADRGAGLRVPPLGF